jgi:hypothetical protein
MQCIKRRVGPRTRADFEAFGRWFMRGTQHLTTERPFGGRFARWAQRRRGGVAEHPEPSEAE